MSKPLSTAFTSFLGLSLGWSYALAAFTLTITCCLPLALLATMDVPVAEGARAAALIKHLVLMAVLLAASTTALYFLWLRHAVRWQNRVLMAMWALSALGMAGWWLL